jgi:hypothetical protein
MLIAVVIGVSDAHPQRVVAGSGSIRIAERSILPGAISRAARLAAERDFDDPQIISDSPELDIIFQTGEPLTACRVESRILKNVTYQGVFPIDIVVRADSALGTVPSFKQSETCGKAARAFIFRFSRSADRSGPAGPTGGQDTDHVRHRCYQPQNRVPRHGSA